METREKLVYSGDLKEEINEMERIFSSEDIVEIPGSTTSRCGAFLTIYCC